MDEVFGTHNLSRVIYMLTNEAVSLGMTDEERETLVYDWMNEVKKYDQQVLQNIHSYSRETGEFNETFIRMMDGIYPRSVDQE